MFKIYKRGNIYHVQFSIRGKRIRESTRTTEKALAEDYASKRYAELFQQIQVGERPAWKWADAVKRYLTEKCGKRRTKTTTYLLKRLDRYFGNGVMALRDISG
ncbi:MAG: hypothetical protein U9P00_06455, partial [Pseudomonadota bacterium]|nr:hypothetical protein [Pseudomonadota bacterium]